MALGTGVYGTNASNAVSYGVGGVTAGGTILASTWSALASTITSERARRGQGSSMPTISANTTILATYFNQLKAQLEVAGPVNDVAYNNNGTQDVITFPQAGVPSGSTAVAIGDTITAAGLNALITELNNAGAVCTCNCNYCTCNCNYACTCNCNYSDERVKTEIEYM